MEDKDPSFKPWFCFILIEHLNLPKATYKTCPLFTILVFLPRVGFSPPLCTNITSTLYEFKLSGIHCQTEAKHKR